MKQITLKNKVLNVNTKYKYPNGRTAIELTLAKTGELWMTASVNIPEAILAKDEVVIKDYSENEGVFKAMLDANIIVDTGRRVETGMVVCPIAKIV